MNIKQIHLYLRSNDSTKISEALTDIENNGDSSVIFPLADLLLTDIEEKKYYKNIVSIFSSLKDSASASVIMDVLHSEIHLPIRQVMLSCMWNTTLDYSEYVADIVKIACWGTWTESFDCLTILENIREEIQEKHLLEAQWNLKEYYESKQKNNQEDEQKDKIISEIARFIKNADLSIQG